MENFIITCYVPTDIEVNPNELPKKWKDFVEAWFTKEGKRTPYQWGLVERHTMLELLFFLRPDLETVGIGDIEI